MRINVEAIDNVSFREEESFQFTSYLMSASSFVIPSEGTIGSGDVYQFMDLDKVTEVYAILSKTVELTLLFVQGGDDVEVSPKDPTMGLNETRERINLLDET